MLLSTFCNLETVLYVGAAYPFEYVTEVSFSLNHLQKKKYFRILQLEEPTDDRTLMTLNLFLKDRMERRATLLTDVANRRTFLHFKFS